MTKRATEQSIGKKVSDAATSVKEGAVDIAKSTRDRIDTTRERANDTAQAATRIITEHPFAAAAAAVAIGAVAAYLFPRTGRRIARLAPVVSAELIRVARESVHSAQKALPDREAVTAAAASAGELAAKAPAKARDAARAGLDAALNAVERAHIPEQAYALADKTGAAVTRAARRLRKSVH